MMKDIIKKDGKCDGASRKKSKVITKTINLVNEK
jgi:hypothetical protein